MIELTDQEECEVTTWAKCVADDIRSGATIDEVITNVPPRLRESVEEEVNELLKD